MVESAGINRLVYDFFEARILFGYYSCGETLPSITKICSMFDMRRQPSAQPDSAGEKRYIRVDARKAAKVTYHALPEEIRRNAAVYLLQREEGIRDIIRTGRHLFGNLWEMGMHRWKEGTLGQLRAALANPAQGMVPMPIKFYMLALSGLENGLIMNLYWDTIQYLMFPYLENHDHEKIMLQNIKGDSVENVISVLNRLFVQMDAQAARQVVSFMDEVRSGYPETGQVPFQWTIYRQRPQIRYTLVSRIIREIMCGSYPAGSYLPSLSQMVKQYGAALSTIRRTLHILDCLGIVQPFHGKGIKVSVDADRLDYSGRDIQEGMHLYKESLGLLTLTIGPVSRYTMESIPDRKRKALAGLFSQLHEEGKSYLCFENYLVFIRSECPSALIRECYGRILELLAWGYPFALQKRKDQNLHLEYDGFVLEAASCLTEGNILAFSENWAKLMACEEQQFSARYVD